MNIFLTGGTGFIGSYVALEMAAQGHRVTILARNPDKVPALAKITNIEIVAGRIADQELSGEPGRTTPHSRWVKGNTCRSRKRNIPLFHSPSSSGP